MDKQEELVDRRAYSRAVVVIADPFVEKTGPLASMLAERGCDVFRSSTLSDAMAMCIAVKPSIVLTELRFPDGLGLDFVKYVADSLPNHEDHRPRLVRRYCDRGCGGESGS